MTTAQKKQTRKCLSCMLEVTEKKCHGCGSENTKPLEKCIAGHEVRRHELVCSCGAEIIRETKPCMRSGLGYD